VNSETQYKYVRKKLEYTVEIPQLFTGFKKAYNLVRREVACNIVWYTHETSYGNSNTFQ